MKNKLRLIFLSVNTLTVWFALVLQFIISTEKYMALGRSFFEVGVLILSFYTIQTNIVIAVALTAILLAPNSGWGRFFSQTSVLTGITIYILIVGLVYAAVLKGSWHLTGLFKVADVLLHQVSPLLFLIFWLFFVPKEKLRWQLLFPWAVFPLVYLIYSLIRGAFTGHYPYPFINAAKLGYVRVMINSTGVVLIFLVFAGLLIGTSRLLARSARPY